MLCYYAGTVEDLRSEHETSGLPIYPSGHVHTALCLTTLQKALGAQTFPRAHGFMHFLDWQAVKSGQSLSWEHPLKIGWIVTGSNIKILGTKSIYFLRNYLQGMQQLGSHCSHVNIHSSLYGKKACKLHLHHKRLIDMQVHNFPESTSFQECSHCQTSTEVWHQLKKRDHALG